MGSCADFPNKLVAARVHLEGSAIDDNVLLVGVPHDQFPAVKALAVHFVAHTHDPFTQVRRLLGSLLTHLELGGHGRPNGVLLGSHGLLVGRGVHHGHVLCLCLDPLSWCWG